MRKTASLETAIPWLYLKGISTGEMQTALEVLVGSEAKGLSASTGSRLKQAWGEEYAAWRQRQLGDEQWVYIGVDGIYSGLRAEQQRLCALIVVGVNARGEKHFLSIEDGMRESTQSWREGLLGSKPVGSPLRSLPWAMAPWGSGWPWKRSSQPLGSNAVGAIRR